MLLQAVQRMQQADLLCCCKGRQPSEADGELDAGQVLACRRSLRSFWRVRQG